MTRDPDYAASSSFAHMTPAKWAQRGRAWRASHTRRVPLSASGAWIVVTHEADDAAAPGERRMVDRWQAFRYASAGERIAAHRDAIRAYDAAVARGAYSASLAEVERSTDY